MKMEVVPQGLISQQNQGKPNGSLSERHDANPFYINRFHYCFTLLQVFQTIALAACSLDFGV